MDADDERGTGGDAELEAGLAAEQPALPGLYQMPILLESGLGAKGIGHGNFRVLNRVVSVWQKCDHPKCNLYRQA